MRTLRARVMHYHTRFNGGFKIPFGLRRERWIGEECKAIGLISNFGIARMKASTVYVSVAVNVIYKFRVRASLGTCIAYTHHYKNSATCEPAEQKTRSEATKTNAPIHVVCLFASVRVFVYLNICVCACVCVLMHALPTCMLSHFPVNSHSPETVGSRSCEVDRNGLSNKFHSI